MAIASYSSIGTYMRQVQFDLDGNQTLVRTTTGDWQVSYNGENRPVSWSCGATNIVMSFDRMGRRVEYLETTSAEESVISDGETNLVVTVTTNAHHLFVYDGYLCIQRLNAAANNAVDLAFGWDPSEPVATRPLWMQRVSGSYSFFYFHDGNKNVSDLVSYQSARGVPAHYEYAPFGAVVAATTNTSFTAFNVAETNPFRFSSEYADDALGLVYYNYRHYEPMMGRWLVLELFPRMDASDLYLFVQNGLYNDYLGLRNMITYARVSDKFLDEPDAGTISAARRLMVYIDSLNTLKVGNCKCFEIEIKDLVGARLKDIADDVKNNNKVYIVAHAGLRVNGEMWRNEEYFWQEGDTVEEVVVPVRGDETVPLDDYLKAGIHEEDVFGCYLAKDYRKVKCKEGVKSSKAQCGALLSDLTGRLERFEVAQRKSKCEKIVKIVIYEGRKDKKWPGFGTEKAKLRHDGLDDYLREHEQERYRMMNPDKGLKGECK